MTKEEVIKNGEFILNNYNSKYSVFKIDLYLDFFEVQQKVEFANVPSLEAEPEMTVVVEIVNELLNYDLLNKEWLKDEIWKNYELCVENTSYGMVPDAGFENEPDANRAYFNIYNRDEAYKVIKLAEIWCDMDFIEFRHFNLSFNCPWDDEHGIIIGVKNGKFDSVN